MIKLVCFDLDDTLTREIHSVMLLCMLGGKIEQLLEIEKRENSGKLNWIDADYQKARLLKGLREDRIKDGFVKIMRPLEHIGETIGRLRDRGIRSILITAGPKQVARVAGELWGFDASYGSDYEVADGAFTGKIRKHVGDVGKIAYLLGDCEQSGILPKDCCAVGDGSTDIPLFQFCSRSIAVNASPAVARIATCSIETNDLGDILRFI